LLPREPGKTPNRMHNIEVVMRIDSHYKKDILSDSAASLVTEGLLGNRYVTITRGYTGVPLEEGQAVPGTGEKAIKEVVERSADVLTNLQALSDDIKDLINGVQRGRGTLGKLLTDEQVYNHLNSMLSKGDQLVSNVQAGQGSLGKLATDETLYNKLRDASSSVSEATAKLNQNTNTAGKLFSDPQLYDNLTGVTGDMRKLIGDFRTNPKKFLHIKLSLF